MYEVIGHEHLRKTLKDFDGSFVVVGPKGVGKKGIVYEWAEDKDDYETFSVWTVDQARELAKRAYAVGSLTALIDGDMVQFWDPLLKPIEEGILRVAVWATKLHLPLASRVSVVGAGFLTEQQVLQILAKSFPTVGPRPWLAKALMGQFGNFNDVYAAVHVFEEINTCLAARSFPKVLRDSPVAVLRCLELASAARVGASNLPWSKAALNAIPRDVAWDLLKSPKPDEKHHARNASTAFFAGVTNGRLG